MVLIFSMFEVEKKFKLDTVDVDALLKDADFLREVRMYDTYFDTKDCQLGKQDTWLRDRNGSFELKVNIVGERAGKRQVDQYQEYDKENEIRSMLGLAAGDDLAADLKTAGFAPIATFLSIRKKYKLEPFTIDIDETDFGMRLGEIEVLVENKNAVPDALKQIEAFAKQNNISLAPVRGKLFEHLRIHRPEYYQVMVDHGIVFDLSVD